MFTLISCTVVVIAIASLAYFKNITNKELIQNIYKAHNIHGQTFDFIYTKSDFSGFDLSYHFEGGVVLSISEDIKSLYFLNETLVLNENYTLEWGTQIKSYQFFKIKFHSHPSEAINLTSTQLFQNYKFTSQAYLALGGHRAFV